MLKATGGDWGPETKFIYFKKTRWDVKDEKIRMKNFIPSFSYDFAYCIYRQIPIFKNWLLRLEIIFLHADFCIFYISTRS